MKLERSVRAVVVLFEFAVGFGKKMDWRDDSAVSLFFVGAAEEEAMEEGKWARSEEGDGQVAKHERAKSETLVLPQRWYRGFLFLFFFLWFSFFNGPWDLFLRSHHPPKLASPAFLLFLDHDPCSTMVPPLSTYTISCGSIWESS